MSRCARNLPQHFNGCACTTPSARPQFGSGRRELAGDLWPGPGEQRSYRTHIRPAEVADSIAKKAGLGPWAKHSPKRFYLKPHAWGHLTGGTDRAYVTLTDRGVELHGLHNDALRFAVSRRLIDIIDYGDNRAGADTKAAHTDDRT